jgi:hypothetical protein
LVDTLSPIELSNLAFAMGLAVSGLGPKAVLVAVERFLETPKEELKNSRLLLSIHEKGAEHVRLAALVKKAIFLGIIARTSSQDYAYGHTILGSREEDVIEKLKGTANQQLRIAIQERVDTAQSRL